MVLYLYMGVKSVYQSPHRSKSDYEQYASWLFCAVFVLLQKRPLTLDPSNIQTPKKQKLSGDGLPLQSPSRPDCGTNGSRSSFSHENSCAEIRSEFDKTSNHLWGSPDGLCSPHKLSAPSAFSKLARTEPAPTSPSPKSPRSDTPRCAELQLTNGQLKKKKSKKHKDKERDRLKPDWIETSPDLKQNQENLKGKYQGSHRVSDFIRLHSICSS